MNGRALIIPPVRHLKWQEENQVWWAKESLRRLELLEFDGLSINIEKRHTTFGTLQRYVTNGARTAFVLLVTDRVLEAQRVAEHTISDAQEAISTQSFEELFSEEDMTPDRQRAQLCSGMEQTLMAQSRATWFLAESLPLELWRQAANWQTEYCKVGYRFDSVIERLLITHIEAELYEEAIALYQQYFKRRLSGKGLQKEYRDVSAAMASLAEHMLSRKPLEDFVVQRINYCYHESTKWGVHSKLSTPDWTRLSWAYLHGKYVAQDTDLKSILYKLRGY